MTRARVEVAESSRDAACEASAMKELLILVCVVLVFSVSGYLAGYMMADAPDVAALMQRDREIVQLRVQLDEYRQRCEDWSYYTWRLQHEPELVNAVHADLND